MGALPLGMESREIRDDQITASSQESSYPASSARLNAGAWMAMTSGLNQWLQVDFERSTIITGISTQGLDMGLGFEYVTDYTISFSNGEQNFHGYKPQGELKVR